MGLLERSEQGSHTNMVAALEHVASLVKKRGLVVILSDFLTAVDELHAPLSYLRSRGHEVMALRMLDPQEVSFAFADATLFRDLESRRPMFVDPQRARDGYLERFEAHRRRLREVCVSLGIDVTPMQTDQPLEQALYHWLGYQIRQAGGGAITRRTASRGGGVA
jgi:uncharacterized protein (DUF58 family)